jgi:hypothetical protein
MWTSILGIGEKLLDIVGRFIPDKEKAQQAATEIEQTMLNGMQTIIQAEMQAGWLAQNWRAIAMLGLTAAIGYKDVMGSMVLAVVDKTPTIDHLMIAIWLLGLTGYQITHTSIDAVNKFLSMFKHKKENDK